MKSLRLSINTGIIATIATGVSAAECNAPHYRMFIQNLEHVVTMTCTENGVEVEYRCDNKEPYVRVAREYDVQNVLNCTGAPLIEEGSNVTFDSGVTLISGRTPSTIIILNNGNIIQDQIEFVASFEHNTLADALEAVRSQGAQNSRVPIFDLNLLNGNTYGTDDFGEGPSITYPEDALIRWGLADANSFNQFCDVEANQVLCDRTANSILQVQIDDGLNWGAILSDPASEMSANYIDTVFQQLPRAIDDSQAAAIALDLAARQFFLETLQAQMPSQ